MNRSFVSNHECHDDTWIILKRDNDVSCIACLVQSLEDNSILMTAKSHSLRELLNIIQGDGEAIISLLKYDLRAIGYVTDVLISMLLFWCSAT